MHNYFHTDRTLDLATLAEAVTRADAEGKSFRVDVDANGSLRYKVGGGMWSAPMHSTLDQFRDRPLPSEASSSRTDFVEVNR